MSGMLRQMGEFLQPDFIWHGPRTERTVYLTFDDGPTPGITKFVLEELAKYNATAAFFCLGKQVEQHPELFEQIKQAGHIVGNHSYNHIDGWKCSALAYMENINGCAQVFESAYFRPPYGRIQPQCMGKLKERFKVIMWDCMPQDFDESLSVTKMLNIAQSEVQAGSIIVLHDNNKAAPALKQLLPQLLQYLSSENYKFGSLNDLVKP